MSNQILPTDAFIRAIGIDSTSDHTVFLGAGASISSGIPSANLCIWEWKRDIFLTNNPGVERQFSELTLPSVQERIQQWLDRQGHYPVRGAREEYSFYIDKCYPIGEHRRLYFADKVRSASPSIGYKLLALLAENNIINSVWTTNFDNLVSKAATGFNISPIEVGIDCQHRSLRQKRKGELLCVSLHGDYRYDELRNIETELQSLESQLLEALLNELENSALIVIGYSGRDRSVMDALQTAYSRPGIMPLYWCGFGDEINEPVQKLLNTARDAGRTAYFVPTQGFDDTFIRLALHCISGAQQGQVKELLSHVSQELRNQNIPFSIPEAPCTALIKSNSFEIDWPSEVFEFEVKEWPQKPWDWLEQLSSGRKFVAVPHRKKVLALGSLNEIHEVFDGYMHGSVERTPVTESDKSIDHGAVNALMRRSLLKAFSEHPEVSTDNISLLWEKASYDKKVVMGQLCYIHRAAAIYLRNFSGRLHLILKPTVNILDAKGDVLANDVMKIAKTEVLGYQHNNKFNRSLERWRKYLLPSKGTLIVEFPSRGGSTARFKIRTTPQFAQIGSNNKDRSINIDNRYRPLIKHQGIEVPEPKLVFCSRHGQRYTHDTHPLRGLKQNRPFDFSLTLQGLSSSIRLGVVCPEKETQILNQYLHLSEQHHFPSKTEEDYLIGYPGFQQAFGIPLELAQPDDKSWGVCSEPKSYGAIKGNIIQLAEQIIRSIDTIVAAEKPHVVLIFVPSRWNILREYQDAQERFDLHNYVKAYCVQKGISTQFLEQDTTISKQQCRIWWWLSLAIYAKAMRTPYVLEALDPDTAFIGLGFTVDRLAPKEKQVVLGCSHLYNAQGEGLQFRLSKVENPYFIGRNPHMSYDDARRVAETIRQLFFESQFRIPSRVVVHKQTQFLREEKEGLIDGLEGVDVVDLLEINIDSALRYVSSRVKPDGHFDEDNYPVRRGTVVKIDSKKALVWCHGVTDALIPGFKYFQGKRHIPAPLLLHRHSGTSSLETIVAEILGLSKMDWNSGDLYSKFPATIYSSKKIAQIGSKLQRFGPMSYDYRLFM